MSRLRQYISSEQVSIADRSFNYGDGCFTTMLRVNEQIALKNYHARRLFNDCNLLRLMSCLPDVTVLDFEELINHIESELLGDTLSSSVTSINSKANFPNSSSNVTSEHNNRSVIKISVSRGVGGRGYAPSFDMRPIIRVSFHDYAAPKKTAFRVAQSNHIALSEQPVLAGIKHNNRLEQVMAKLELADYSEVDDLLLCNEQGILCECTASNFFYRKNGKWFTPLLARSGVAGVMRAFIIDYMRQEDIAIELIDEHKGVLIDIEEAFICNALSGVMPVEELLTLSASDASSAGSGRFESNNIKHRNWQRRVLSTIEARDLQLRISHSMLSTFHNEEMTVSRRKDDE